MQINPYVVFNGTCEEAFKFYQEVTGGRIEMMLTYGNSPAQMQTTDDFKDKIIHARLCVGNWVLMGSDAPAGRYAAPQGMQLHLGVTTVADAERVFAALSQGGTVQMPLQKTFWAERFGMLVDRFGIPWMVNKEA